MEESRILNDMRSHATWSYGCHCSISIWDGLKIIYGYMHCSILLVIVSMGLKSQKLVIHGAFCASTICNLCIMDVHLTLIINLLILPHRTSV